MKFFGSSIKLLEGEYDRKEAECMLSVIDFKQLAEKAKDIYEFLVRRRLKLFMQNRRDCRESFNAALAATAAKR